MGWRPRIKRFRCVWPGHAAREDVFGVRPVGLRTHETILWGIKTFICYLIICLYTCFPRSPGDRVNSSQFPSGEERMKNLIKAASIATLLAASASANAWGPWGGGPGGWGDDWFGDGFGDFNMNMSARGNGWGRGYNYYRPYYYGPYGYGYPYYGAPYGYAPYAAPAAPAAPAAKPAN
jgi:hypothetical protein